MTIRPIGMRNPLSKLLNGIMIGENKAELVEFFEPQQIAMSDAGSAKLVHCIRLLSEMELVKIEDQRVAEQQEEFGPWQEELVGVKIGVLHLVRSAAGSSSTRH